MFFWLYNIIFIIFFIPVSLIYFISSLFRKKNLLPYFKKFFYKKNKSSNKNIHFHAVSVGEVLSIKKILKELSKKNKNISLSIGTGAGYRLAFDRYKKYVDKILFSPLDLWFSVRSFVNNVNPRLFIVVEAEFWFNLYYFLNKKRIPIWLINFRVSNKKNYLRFKFYYKRVFSYVDKFFVPENEDKRFLLKFGVKEEKIIITGNLKIDISLERTVDINKEGIKQSLNIKNNKKILVCGSTFWDEEKRLLKFLKKFTSKWKILLAPRHIERSNDILNFAKKLGYRACKKTQLKTQNYDVLIIDTIGDLYSIYSVADLAFVGGSLIPLGGHNVLEPVSHGVPTVTGKYYKNFKYAVDPLKKKNGIFIINDVKELIDLMKLSSKELEGFGKKSKRIIENMKGGSKIFFLYFEKEIN